MEQNNKRNRGCNYSKDEELLLLKEIEKFKDIIDCKLTDKVHTSEKNEAWKKILIRFNAKNSSARTLEQLKIKFDNLKGKARKFIATNKNHDLGTGVGSSQASIISDPVIESVLRIINVKTVIGLENTCDSDGTFVTNIEQEESSNLNINNLIKTEPEYDFDQEITEPVESVLEFQPNIQNTSDTSIDNVNLNIEKNTQKPECSKWNYSPKKFKTPVTRRLRQPMTHPVKEEYYKKKINLIEEEVKKNRLEQEEILIRRAMANEKHQKEMILLDLDIRLKKRNLNEKLS